ncbi:MAG TPA: glycosyltransferase family 1 protein [Candidatus Rubrimentiphilum sp.]|nr:glycosyltransferase family 1 protein [Candidatus Rubrimentiphilum sp.]
MMLAVDAWNLAADRRGMGRYVRRVLYGLQALGEDDVSLIVRDRGTAQSLEGEFDYPLIETRELRKKPPHTVWYPWNGMRFAPHAPCFVTIYDPFAFTFPHKNIIARVREQAPIRRAVREADAKVTISEWSAGELHKLFGINAAGIDVVPPVIEPFWHPVAAEPGLTYVLFVAGPDERKNAALLFDAFEAAFEDQAVELMVAGELNAEDTGKFERMRALKRRVRPDDVELRSLYSGAVAVAVPSLAEGFGLPAVEAMACGAPVLAANAAALPEACDGGALLIDPSDRIAWRDALLSVHRDAQLRAMLREAGLARVARFDPLAPARGILEVVRMLS